MEDQRWSRVETFSPGWRRAPPLTLSAWAASPTVEIIALPHSPVQSVLKPVRDFLGTLGGVKVIELDPESPAGEKRIKAVGVKGHVPILLLVNGRDNFKRADGTRSCSRIFPPRPTIRSAQRHLVGRRFRGGGEGGDGEIAWPFTGAMWGANGLSLEAYGAADRRHRTGGDAGHHARHPQPCLCRSGDGAIPQSRRRSDRATQRHANGRTQGDGHHLAVLGGADHHRRIEAAGGGTGCERSGRLRAVMESRQGPFCLDHRLPLAPTRRRSGPARFANG